MGYIYMLTSPSGKAYIGQTFRPIQTRLEEHETGKSSGCVAIYNAIQYHGWNNFEKDWYECPDEDLNKHEELMVEVLRTLSPNGYNLREGGGSHGKMSEESKQKNREAHLGISKSEEHKQKIGEAQQGEKNHMYGKSRSDETNKKHGESIKGDKNHMFGKTTSKETKQKQREAKKGEKNSWYGRTGDKHHGSKRVYQYDLDDNFVRSFGSSEEAARHLNKKNGSNIRACARGDARYKTTYKFKWSYIKYCIDKPVIHDN
jgi:group I intron endonuclease